MKMLVTVYSDSVDEVVLKVFKGLGVTGYTKWKEVLGEGSETEPKLGTHCWPGKNNVLAVVVEDDLLLPISKALGSLKEGHPKGGIRTFVLQVEETI
jgi:hypothetical protein